MRERMNQNENTRLGSDENARPTRFSYDSKYFERYLQKGKFSGRLTGDKRAHHKFWISYLKKRMPASARILEAGCGLGFFGRQVQKEFWYVGLDISPDALIYARDINGMNIPVSGEAGSLPFKDRSFNGVVAFDVVEHLVNPDLFFHEARRVLKPRGLLVLTTPNISSFGNKVKRTSEALTPAMDTDASHVSLLSTETWIKRISETKLVIEEMGTDTLWDLPYSNRIPMTLQKAALIPFNLLVSRLFGFLTWRQGENLVIVARS